MIGLKKTKRNNGKRKRLVPLYTSKDLRFPKGIRDFVFGNDDLPIFEPNGNFNANLALRAVARKFDYNNLVLAERLGVDPVQICRWINYKHKIQKSWTLLIYNEFFVELDIILNGELKKTYRKDPNKIWKNEDEDELFDRYQARYGPRKSRVFDGE